jgi:hypothetical protein
MSFKCALISAALIAAFWSSPGRAHDIYMKLVDKLGVPCCNHTDCQPTRITPHGVRMLVEERWSECRTMSFISHSIWR